ncbi:MAG TPA: hypothetical protein DCE42_20870 [Myxococcales bacterium]|nr:hypothetical protein [Deltaproteobacteria bacterium]HAA57232.1 hypothetical protein [Myxococcales bacterium]|tara:strand:- start:24675 stop:26075 length:1401 start_codon:yes stop_codon:yes gene_type:complete
MSEAEQHAAHSLSIFRSHKQQPAFFEGTDQHQWGDILQRVEEKVAGLAALDIHHDDIVLLSLPPSVDLFVYVFALQYLGTKTVVLPTTMPRGDLMRWINATNITASILDAQVVQRIDIDLRQRPQHRVGILHQGPPRAGWQQSISLPNTGLPAPHADTFQLLTLSSGTFTPPHMLRFTNAQLLQSAKAFAQTLREHVDTTHATQHLPWNITMWTTSIGCLLAEGSITFPSPTSPPQPISIASGYAPLPTSEHIQHQLLVGPYPTHIESSTPHHALYTVEAAAGVVSWSSTPTHGLGTPLQGYQLSLKRERPVTLDKPGDIQLKTDTLTQETIDIEGRTSPPPTENGWLNTEDIGQYDTRKRIHLQGPKARRFGKGVQQFWAERIEKQLLQHPQVLAATLYNKPTPPKTLKLCVQIAPHTPGQATTTQSVLAYLREHFPHYMLPTLIEFRDEIPKNAMGQVEYWRLP